MNGWMAYLQVLALSTLMVASNSSDAGWFGPSNYNECVTETTKNARTNYIAIQATQACKRQFEVEIPTNQLDLIRINSGAVKFNEVDLNIYNQLSSYDLTKLIVRIAPKEKYALHAGISPVIYSFDVFVPSSSSKTITAAGDTYLFDNIKTSYHSTSGSPPKFLKVQNIDQDILTRIENGQPAYKFNIQIIKAFGVPQ